jgi:hypothetical protein
VRHAQVDEPRLFLARHHLDREPERGLGLDQELARVLGHAQTIGAHRAHRLRRQPAQALAEALERVQRALLRGLVEAFVGGDARGQAHRLAQRVERIDLVVDDAGDLESKTVGAEITP